MKVSDIDKDFVSIIENLNQNGFKPFVSCDGVLENHSDKDYVSLAYISFLKSSKIVDLMGAFNRDKETFSIKFSNDSSCEPYSLYGNLIEGNSYSVYFDNKEGKVTNYFEKIITGMIEEKINISDEEKQNLISLDSVLENCKESKLFLSVQLNTEYAPHMKKEGKINSLTIYTKWGYEYIKNMGELANLISKRLNIQNKSSECDNEVYEEDEFVISYTGSECIVYFVDNHMTHLLELIEYIKQVENSLSETELKEPEIDFPLIDDGYEEQEF